MELERIIYHQSHVAKFCQICQQDCHTGFVIRPVGDLDTVLRSPIFICDKCLAEAKTDAAARRKQ